MYYFYNEEKINYFLMVDFVCVKPKWLALLTYRKGNQDQALGEAPGGTGHKIQKEDPEAQFTACSAPWIRTCCEEQAEGWRNSREKSHRRGCTAFGKHKNVTSEISLSCPLGFIWHRTLSSYSWHSLTCYLPLLSQTKDRGDCTAF